METWDQDLPPQFQYFDSTPALGGGFAQKDFCPFYHPLADAVCVNPTHAPAANENYQGQAHNAEARCFESSLAQASEVAVRQKRFMWDVTVLLRRGEI